MTALGRPSHMAQGLHSNTFPEGICSGHVSFFENFRLVWAEDDIWASACACVGERRKLTMVIIICIDERTYAHTSRVRVGRLLRIQ